ncbi:hypothetical protein PENSUB_6920 [Penicillium subrubescens]|uniref:Uncharacterized protein n=1 Tax=Penicillium subrubescens TaxID=1316194 RepID=A0A1Q5TRJ4_9EURO|nr:hypothetical protein PENSUB_6920 [Penicillium subrubescens]
MATEAALASFDVRADVDFMTLDYLACFALDIILAAAGTANPSPELEDEVKWTASLVEKQPIPLELDVKLRVFALAHDLWNYPDPQTTATPASASAATNNSPALARIGIDFLRMCQVAAHRVSETRWFDVGGRFMIQSALLGVRQGVPVSLRQFSTWTPDTPERRSKWWDVRESYAAEIPDDLGDRAAWVTLDQQYPFAHFKAIVVEFLFELMTTLDAPILLQLERGKLDGWTPEETQQLMKEAGMI